MPSAPTEVPVQLRWSDMDAFGHVNNVQFLRLLEIARISGLPQWFGDLQDAVHDGVMVARHEIEYDAPLEYRPEPVVVRMWVTRLGGSGFDVGYWIVDPPEVGSTRYAVAATTMVLYDFAAARPRRMSPGEREALRAHLGEPVHFRRRR